MAARPFIRSLFFGLLLTLFAVNVFAANGHISGRITRENGSGIGGVIVQVVETGAVELSDANGDFRLSAAPGTYSLQFVAGENVTTESNVVVTDGNTTRVDKKVD